MRESNQEIEKSNLVLLTEMFFFFFIQRLFTNYTEWNCDIRTGSGIDPILFESKTLAWRVPTVFMVNIFFQFILINKYIYFRYMLNIYVKV
jgi:hypothetical protein